LRGTNVSYYKLTETWW